MPQRSWAKLSNTTWLYLMSSMATRWARIYCPYWMYCCLIFKPLMDTMNQCYQLVWLLPICDRHCSQWQTVCAYNYDHKYLYNANSKPFLLSMKSIKCLSNTLKSWRRWDFKLLMFYCLWCCMVDCSSGWGHI